MTLPVPTLDHVVVNVHDGMDAAVETYRRLGFAMTPRGHHTLGSINHLAIFATNYLELIGVPPGTAGRTDILGWPIGLNGLVWGTEDSAALHAALGGAGVSCPPPGEFSRPVELPDGTRDAVFRTVRLPNDTTPAGRLYFCHHLTRDLVWRDEWRHHPNGVVDVAQAVIAAAAPQRLGALFRRMFGDGAVQPIAGGLRLVAGLTSMDVVTPAELARRFGDAAPQGDTRDEYMAALVLRTRSLAQAAGAVQAEGVRREATRLLVPATQTMGVVLQFQE
ncbi:VOC family protein [Limobrevibacterium gyesilva]|uniref:VOC family protein n=1 Tax=Limobrevibacterium gyesilva TaxID=2991712 RepID=A0AA41YRQ9_9PROT|nr:VOC family protein [Limobrevibacterium gyesilva]MCW3474297.1 VOC family protein [Limobrevibacterium gyesilva]